MKLILTCCTLAILVASCSTPIKLEKGVKIQPPLSHQVQCGRAETWNKWICTNERPGN